MANKKLNKRKKPSKFQTAVFYALGILVSMGAGGFCFMGVTTVFAHMNEESERAITSVLQLTKGTSQNGYNVSTESSSRVTNIIDGYPVTFLA